MKETENIQESNKYNKNSNKNDGNEVKQNSVTVMIKMIT